MDEKLPSPRSRLSLLAVSLTAIRVWQWSSSIFVYASFGLLYRHVSRNRLGENGRIRSIQVLGLVALVYSTLVICGVHLFKTLRQPSWRLFAIMSVPGDLTITGIYLAQITLLSIAGLPADCHGLTREEYNGSDLVRQPDAGFSTIRFGPGNEDSIGELDRLCTFPRTVYGLSVLAIFSYTFSILLTVLYIIQHRQEVGEKPNCRRQSTLPGFINEAVPDMRVPTMDNVSRPPSPGNRSSSSRPHPRDAFPPRPSSSRQEGFPYTVGRSHRQSAGPTENARASQPVPRSDGFTWAAITTPDTGSESDLDSTFSNVPLSGSFLPSPPCPSGSGALPSDASRPRPPQRRWSTSTSSSYDAEAFVVTDGFRPGTEPPAYSSRPGSLYQESMKYEAGLTLGRGGGGQP